MDSAGYDEHWDDVERCFGYRPGTTPDAWPAIREPTPSVTFDLAVIPDGAHRGAAYDGITAEALRCFLGALPDVPEFIVLDWQHSAYLFRPATQARAW